MGRVVKRVPESFDWPLEQVWEGYLSPYRFAETPCPECLRPFRFGGPASGDGYSSYGRMLNDAWYGYNGQFRPEDNGSVPLTVDTPAVRAFAERNVGRDPQFYGYDEGATVREAQRLIGMWNQQWSHHLNQDDVDALVEAGRLRDLTHTWDANREPRFQPIDPPVKLTPEIVNDWHTRGMGHDAINQMYVLRARAARDGLSLTCSNCEGHGSLEAYPGQREEAENWEPSEPPVGEGWQLWETVSEGSPVSPVFSSSEELAQWLTTPQGGDKLGPSGRPMSLTAARRFVGEGWAPSMVMTNGVVEDGAHWIGGSDD
jgi:hypothetical protein